MSLFTAGEMSLFTSVCESAMSQTATIQRVTRTPDGGGDWSESWATIATVACLVTTPGRRRPEERETAGRLTSVSLWSIWLPAGTDVLAADRIVVGSATYEVAGPMRPITIETHCEVDCVRVL